MHKFTFLASCLLAVGLLFGGSMAQTEPPNDAAAGDRPPHAERGPHHPHPDDMRGRHMQKMLGVGPLLRIEAVRKELKVDDNQTEQLRIFSVEIRKEFGDSMRSLFGSLRDLPQEERRERMKEIREKAKEVRTRIDERLQEVLQPDQLKRLRQIDLQLRMRRHAVSVLSSDEVAEALDLTQEQKVELRERAKQARKEAQQQIREAFQAAHEKVKEVLTLEQQEKLESLLGPEFDLPQALLDGSPSDHPAKRGFRGKRKPSPPTVD